MEAWLRSERICLSYLDESIKCLALFYAPDSSTFRVSYAEGDEYSSYEEPNAATSLIGIVASESARSRVVQVDVRSWTGFEGKIISARNSLLAASPASVLPLRSFGVLPLFSTSYLVEFLGNVKSAFSNKSFIIGLRRILFELYLQQNTEAISGRPPRRLHPFLLFRCVRSALTLKALFSTYRNEAVTFRDMLFDPDLLIDLDETARDKAEQICGFKEPNDKFNVVLKTEMILETGEQGPYLSKLLELAEKLASTEALFEIAKHKGSVGRKADPSSLVFSLAILSELGHERHGPLIRQGLRVVMDCCEHGLFPSALPFNIDAKGRALFSPSVEIASTALSVTIQTIGEFEEDISFILEATNSVQDRLLEEYHQVGIVTDRPEGEFRKGWSSDRASSSDRVDSWITAHAFSFFLNRVRLIRRAKRGFVLGRYNWDPYTECKPRWSEIIDPDLGLCTVGVKGIIESVVMSTDRDKAPVFLLYGPPGTSKTTLVKGIAAGMSWDFVSLSPSDFVVDSLDRIEYRSREIFRDLMNLDRCVILMDEMDSLLRDRELIGDKNPGTIMEFVVPAILPKLQQLRDYSLKRDLAIFFVTNYYETLDPAVVRAGRIDNHIVVLPYSRRSTYEVATKIINTIKASDHHVYLESVRSVIDKLPATLVYRDIEELVKNVIRAVDSGRDPVGEVGLLEALGVQPEIYDPNRRPRAFREVCAIVDRILDHGAKRNYYEKMSAANARKHLENSLSSFPENHPWRGLLRDWIDSLSKRRS